MPSVRIKYGGNEWSVDLKDTNIIGRSSKCDVTIKDVGLSRKHCEIKKVGDAWVVRDNDSKNGTKVNDNTVTEHKLLNGDIISIGSVTMRFTADGSAAMDVGKGATAIAELFTPQSPSQFAKNFVSHPPSESAIKELDAALPQQPPSPQILTVKDVEAALSKQPPVSGQASVVPEISLPPSERKTVRAVSRRTLLVSNIILLILFVLAGAIYFIPATKSTIGGDPMPFNKLTYPWLLAVTMGGAILSILLPIMTPFFHVKPFFYWVCVSFALMNLVVMYSTYAKIKNEIEAYTFGNTAVGVGPALYSAIVVNLLICVVSIISIVKIKRDSQIIRRRR